MRTFHALDRPGTLLQVCMLHGALGLLRVCMEYVPRMVAVILILEISDIPTILVSSGT